MNTGNYTLVYRSTDSVDNVSTITRYLTILDIIPPVMTVNGDNPLNIYKGSLITDPGVTSLDNINGNLNVYLITILSGTVILSSTTILSGVTNLLSNDVLITSSTTNINISLNIGNYTLVYRSTDSANNVSTITRYLNILTPIPKLYKYNTTNLALTSAGISFATAFQFNSTNSNLISTGRMANWAFKTSIITETNFLCNGAWSLIIKFKLDEDRPSHAYDFLFDVSLTGWNEWIESDPTNHPGMYVEEPSKLQFRFGPILGGAGMRTNLVDTDDNLDRYSREGIYMVITRNSNNSQFINLYNLNKDLICSYSSIGAYTYINKQCLFSFFNDRSAPVTFYSGILFSTSVILTPNDWITYVG